MSKPDYWQDLTDKMITVAYNGVGPEFFPKWLRELLDSVLKWAKEAVIVHDVEYTYSKSKIKADIRFLKNLLYLSRKRKEGKKDKVAIALFLAVFFCGKKAWEASRQKQ